MLSAYKKALMKKRPVTSIYTLRMGKQGLLPFILEAWIYTQLVDNSLFESVDGMDINMFLDTLLTLGDKAVYQANATASDLLQDFLEGSENLWGMVNWENGTCNFDTDLFTKLLQAAKNLEDSGRKSYIPVSEKESYSSFFSFAYYRSQMSEAQMVLGKPFDDGFHGKEGTNIDSLVINANSPNKKSAWEFVSYLLSQEAQDYFEATKSIDQVRAVVKNQLISVVNILFLLTVLKKSL